MKSIDIISIDIEITKNGIKDKVNINESIINDIKNIKSLLLNEEKMQDHEFRLMQIDLLTNLVSDNIMSIIINKL